MAVPIKKTALSILLIAALLALWLIDLADETQAPKEKVGSSISTKNTDLNPISNKVPKEQALEVIASTPISHDQLVISSSLEGTDIDGALKADAAGNLVLDLAVRDFFDYFLSVADELGPENAIAEIERYARAYLPERAGDQAVELLSNYLRYKRAEFELQQTPIAQTDLNDASALNLIEQSFKTLKATRKALFSEQQDTALFGLEDQYANHTLATLRIMADETSDQQQKRDQLTELESQLPNELITNAQTTRDQKQRQASIENTLLTVSDDSQAYESLVGQGLSEQKASELIAVRQEHQQFERSYSDYSLAKNKLDKQANDYQQQLSALQKQFFISPEQQTKARLSDLRSKVTE